MATRVHPPSDPPVAPARPYPRGLRFYAQLLGLHDAVQLEELDRVLAAAAARGEH